MIVTLAVYWPLRSAGWVYEDQNIRDALGLNANWTLDLTGILFGGASAWAFHVGNLLIHLGNTLMLGLSAKALTNTRIAILSAAIFVIQPINSEAVSYIAARTELVSAFWCLLAIWIALGLTWKDDVRAMLILVCIGAAVLTKASAIVAVGLVPLAIIIGKQSSLWRILCPFLTLAVFLGCGYALNIWRNPYSFQSEWGPLRYAGIQAYALLSMLVSIITLHGFTIDPDWQIATPLMCALALGAVTCAAMWAISAADYWPITCATIAWVLIGLFPRFILRSPEMLHFHHFYLPFAGLATAISYGVFQLMEVPCDARSYS